MKEPFKVALYHLDENTERGRLLHQILKDLNISSTEIRPEDLGQKVGFIAGMDGYESDDTTYTGEIFDYEFMLMCGLPEKVLDAFLDAMQAQKLRVNYKAVVTQHNKDYVCARLVADIAREHELVQAWMQLNKLVRKTTSLPAAMYSKSPAWQDLQNITKMAQVVLQRDDATRPQLEQLHTLLNTKYNQVTKKK